MHWKNKDYKNAMNKEFNALQFNNTWELVEPQENVKIIGDKWVLQYQK